MVIAIVEHYFEQPFDSLQLTICQEPRPSGLVVQQRRFVPVVDPFQISIGRATHIVPGAPIAFAHKTQIDADSVFLSISIEDSVALVVSGLTNEPAENPPRLSRIDNPGISIDAINGQDILFGK